MRAFHPYRQPLRPLETLSRRSVGLKPASSPTLRSRRPSPSPRSSLYSLSHPPAARAPLRAVYAIHASAMGAGTALTALMHSANIASAVASGSLFTLRILSRACVNGSRRARVRPHERSSCKRSARFRSQFRTTIRRQLEVMPEVTNRRPFDVTVAIDYRRH